MTSNHNFTREDFDNLSALSTTENRLCLSLLMPTHQHLPSTQQDATLLKNLLRKAEADLAALGQTEKQIQTMLAPIRVLAVDEIWNTRSAGLAVYSTGDAAHTHFFHLPFSLPEFVVISQHFYVKPLLPVLQHADRFFVLALSQNAIALYRFCENSSESPKTILLPNTPQSVLTMPQHEDLNAQRHARTHTRSSVGGSQTIHSHGVGDINHKTELLRYFKSALTDVLFADRLKTIPIGTHQSGPISPTPQIAFRLGYGEPEIEHTPRRPLEDVLLDQ